MASTQTSKSRSVARKSPPTVAPAPKPSTRKKKTVAPAAAIPPMTAEEWRQKVAAAAYLRAEARGFVGGSAEQDWLDAEAELVAKLASK
ncbi:MAG TPA: DUF2934 domain-containing protein [Burkholderiales bacterium]